MKRTLAVFALKVCATSCLLGQMAGMGMPDVSAIPVTRPSNVTFTKDVAPIVQQNCQACHRPGEAAPFSMFTYEQARPWATAMKRMVADGDAAVVRGSAYGEVRERSLVVAGEIQTIAAWVDAGAPKGRPQGLASANDFVEGWTIPKPDVFQLPKRSPCRRPE